VLVAGGAGPNGSLASAELYNPFAGTWSSTGSLANVRSEHTATRLANGMVLVASGTQFIGPGGEDTLPGYTASAELYDPATGRWTSTGSLATARSSHTATLLPGGQVLVAGGTIMTSSGSTYFSSAELYDPSSGNWWLAPSLANARWQDTATMLGNGQVLVAGGGNLASGALASSELFTPQMTAVPAMPAWALLATFAGLCGAGVGLRRRRLPADGAAHHSDQTPPFAACHTDV
jgi:Kelch motif/Galactose oxidase, central domain